jgi:hypothetical protein
MPIRVYNEDKGGEVDEEEVVYPRRGSTEELGALNIKDTSDAPLVRILVLLGVQGLGMTECCRLISRMNIRRRIHLFS